MTMCRFVSVSFRASLMVLRRYSHPDRRLLVADRNSKLKALGDESRVPCLQNMGMHVHVPPSANAGPDAFERLAKGYVVPDGLTKKKEVCALNAEVSALG